MFSTNFHGLALLCFPSLADMAPENFTTWAKMIISFLFHHNLGLAEYLLSLL